jgi:pimeloyl-ACP methyl ester carboxylesterase
MSVFVLVHGAWQGPRTWDWLSPLLQKRGHQVIAVTLTGLGEDVERLSPAVNLSTHTEDVTRELTQRGLSDVILVGHSYAGMVITGVADRKGEQLRRLIYLDAFLPENGKSALDLLPADIQAVFRELARAHGDGWRIPSSEAILDLWGLTPGPVRDFVRERLSDFSLRCFEEKLHLARDLGTLPATYVHSAAERYAGREVFRPFADSARERGWECHELPTGHQCQAEAPEAVASILLAHAN